jgi:hypothetical protein
MTGENPPGTPLPTFNENSDFYDTSRRIHSALSDARELAENEDYSKIGEILSDITSYVERDLEPNRLGCGTVGEVYSRYTGGDFRSTIEDVVSSEGAIQEPVKDLQEMAEYVLEEAIEFDGVDADGLGR